MDIQPTSNPSTPQRHNRTATILLAAVIILALAAAYLFFNRPSVVPVDESANQTAETDSWPIYRNSQFGFEVRYPAGWEIWHQTEAGANIADPNDSNNKFLSVAVYPADPENIFRGTDVVVQKVSIELDGMPGTKLIGDSARSAKPALTAIVFKNGQYYTLQAPADIFEKILSTFKFTAQAENAGWKTYSSQKYGFEVNYPPAIKVVGIMSENSVLGTYQAPVPGVHIGPLVFVIRQTNADRQFAESYLDNYLATADNSANNPDGPSVGCQRQVVNNAAVTAVACTGEGGAAYYALIKGYEYDVFVDGYSRGFGQLTADELGGFEDNEQINQMLTTFKFTN